MLRLLTISLCLSLAAPAATADVRKRISAGLLQSVRAAIADSTVAVRIRTWKAAQPALLRRATRLERVELVGRSRPYGNVTARVWLRMRDGRQQAAFVTARVEAKVGVWVANRRIERGAPLGPDNLRAETRSLSRIPRGALRASQSLGERVASRPLAAGLVLTGLSAKTPLLIERGAQVAVAVRVGGVLIRARGKALMSGRLGEQVRVRVDGSRKVLAGRVDGYGKVSINR